MFVEKIEFNYEYRNHRGSVAVKINYYTLIGRAIGLGSDKITSTPFRGETKYRIFLPIKTIE